MRKTLSVYLIRLVLIVFLVDQCLGSSSIYKKVDTSEFDEFDLQDTRKYNNYRKENGLVQLKYDPDLIDLAQSEAERIAELGNLDKIDFNSTDLNIFAYIIKYTGQLKSTSEYLGRYTCADNFSKTKYAKSYELDETCSSIDQDIFMSYGVGRAKDTKGNLFVIRIYSFNKNVEGHSRMIATLPKQQHASNNTFFNLNTNNFNLTNSAILAN